MLDYLKTALRAALRSAGFTVNRIPPEDAYRFFPKPENRFLWLRELGIRTVLDVGAHTGESALQFREILPDAAIYSFEPLKDCFQELEKNLSGLSGCRAFNVAIGDQMGTGTIHRSAYSASSSLLPMADLHKSAYPFSAAESTEIISIETLDSVCSRLDLREEILIKIDTQGFEKNVLMGAIGILERTRLIIVETSFGELYRDQPRFPEIYRMLESLGFEYRGSWDQFLNPKDGIPIQQDGIFLRPPRSIGVGKPA